MKTLKLEGLLVSQLFSLMEYYIGSRKTNDFPDVDSINRTEFLLDHRSLIVLL